MGRWYRLINLDAKVYIDVYDSDTWEQEWQYILYAISYEAKPLRFKMSTLLRGAVESATTTNITSLPLELIDMIFDLLDDQLDVFCLAVTCRATWCAAERRIQGLIRTWAHGWAGHRIIYVNDEDDATHKDFPRDLELTSEDGEDFCTECGLDSDEEGECPCARGESCENLRVCNFYDWAAHRFTEMFERFPYDLASSLVDDLGKRFSNSTAGDVAELATLERVIRQLVPDADLRETNEENLVLCNTSRKLYVRGDAIVERNRNRPDHTRFNMATVILRRTVWGARRGREDPDNRILHGGHNGYWRAAWAGDRLKLITVAEMDKLLDQEDENGEPMPWIDTTVAASAFSFDTGRGFWQHLLSPASFHFPTLFFDSTEGSLSVQTSPVANLPNEVLEAIFLLLDDPLDVLCLAFACRATWQASEQAIRAFVKPWQDGWRGHRIFCVADTEGATMDDAIGTLELSAEEEREMREAGELYFLGYLPSYAEIGDTLLPWTDLADTFLNPLYERMKKNGESIDRLLGKVLRRLFQPRRPIGETGYVLRNLTRKVVVRGDAIAEFNQKYQSVLRKPASLADAAFARATWQPVWARNPPRRGRGWIPGYMRDRKRWRGVWAGNRFDIVPMAVFEQEKADAGDDWVDESSSLVEEIYGIWVEEDQLEDTKVVRVL
ncbi:hypothetical protein K523DRAFT_420544 [Schizophyllum commune Tattone D]|nr:hypothetical protein K523DRAFT_420544 [Schizophyllum commune Tattone D]